MHIPQCNRKSGSRDIVLLSLLYDSGARVQEMCDLYVGDITFGKTSKIGLHGKGNKTSEVPISFYVVELLRYYLRENTFLETPEYLDDYLPRDPMIVDTVHKYKRIDRV